MRFWLIFIILFLVLVHVAEAAPVAVTIEHVHVQPVHVQPVRIHAVDPVPAHADPDPVKIHAIHAMVTIIPSHQCVPFDDRTVMVAVKHQNDLIAVQRVVRRQEMVEIENDAI